MEAFALIGPKQADAARLPVVDPADWQTETSRLAGGWNAADSSDSVHSPVQRTVGPASWKGLYSAT